VHPYTKREYHERLYGHAGRYESSDKLMSLVKHAESDAWLALGLCFYLNVLPLTRQLSNLSGSLWSKALQGQRAQRIEMLLLHEFHQQKFMLPDKLSIKVIGCCCCKHVSSALVQTRCICCIASLPYVVATSCAEAVGETCQKFRRTCSRYPKGSEYCSITSSLSMTLVSIMPWMLVEHLRSACAYMTTGKGAFGKGQQRRS